MTEINWVLDNGFIGIRFYDLPNFLICIIFILAAGRVLRIPALYQSALTLHCLIPFFLNGFLFPYSYMPDALKYWRAVNLIRSGDLSIFEALTGNNVDQAAAFFSFLPFPFAITPLSLGFFNTGLYIGLFCWLYHKRVFTRISIWFFLMYPSLALYTGMGLRDTFILLLMVLATQWAREGRWLFMLLILIPLYIIKFQNFFIIGPILAAYLVFDIHRNGLSTGRATIALIIGVGSLILLSPVVLPLVNFFRSAMYVEDGGDIGKLQLIGGPVEFVLQGVQSGVYFLLKPFPWESEGILQLIQSVENLLVFGFMFLLVRAAWHRSPKKLVFWVLFLAVSLSIYGLVVFNYGTAARYRFPFIVIFVLFVCADCQIRSLFRPMAPGHLRVGYQPFLGSNQSISKKDDA